MVIPMESESSVEEKSPVNLRIKSSLKEKAKSLGANRSRTLEVSLERAIRRREQEAWLAGNSEALDVDNRRIDKRGPALSAYRSF